MTASTTLENAPLSAKRVSFPWPETRDLEYLPFEERDENGRVVHAEILPVVVWNLTPGEKVSKAILAASEVFALRTGIDPDAAVVHSIPPGASEFVVVGTTTLYQEGSMQPGYVMVYSMHMKRTEVVWSSK